MAAEKDVMSLWREDAGITGDQRKGSPFEEEEEKKPEAETETEEVEEEEVETEEEEVETEEETTEEEEDEVEEEQKERLLKVPKRKKGKPSKEEHKQNVGQLRKKKDELQSRVDDLEEENKKLKAGMSEDALAVINFIQDRAGDINGVTLDHVKELFEVQDKFEDEHKQFEAYKRDRDIKDTKEWQDNYAQPYKDAEDTFYALIVNSDDNGEVANVQYFTSLSQNLMQTIDQKSGNVSATKIRSVIDSFANQYQEATGEEYVKPAISELASSMRSLVRRHQEAAQAYSDWEKNLDSRKKARDAQEQIQSEQATRKQKRVRLDLARTAITDFDYDSVENVFDDEVIETTFNDVHDRNEAQWEDPNNTIAYNDLLTIQTKGALFDDLLDKYTKLLEKTSTKEEVTRGSRTTSKPGKVKTGRRTSGDFLGEHNPLKKRR